MNRRPRTLIVLLAIGATISPILSGCFRKDSPREVEPAPSAGEGRLFLADGRPARYATVRIYKVGQVPGALAKRGSDSGAALVTRTDANGIYQVTDLGKDEFNILAELGDAYAYQDSLVLQSGSGPIPPDTLRPGGGFRGYAAVEPQDNPRTVTVQLMGTNRYVNVEADGRFEFKDLAEGEYTARFVSTAAEYTPTFVPVRVRAGQTAELADSLHLIFTGIPIVRGIAAVHDTAKGLTRLSWSATGYGGFSEYQVFRDPAGSASSGTTPVHVTADTTWTDTLYRGDSALFAPPAAALRYRVAIIDKGNRTGPLLGYSEVRPAPPSSIRTGLEISMRGGSDLSATVGDSVFLRVDWENPAYRILEIQWTMEGRASPVRSLSPASKSGSDSLLFIAGSVASESGLGIRARDESGFVTEKQFRIRIVDDAPAVTLAAASPKARIGDTVRLHGVATDRGRIRAYAWSIGKDSEFMPASGPDTAFVVKPAYAYPGYVPVRLKVSDEDGNETIGDLNVGLVPWQTLPRMPRKLERCAAVAHGGYLYVAGGIRGENVSTALLRFDPVANQWTQLPDMPTPHMSFGFTALGDDLYSLAGRDIDPRQADYTVRCERYSISGGKWSLLPDVGFNPDQAAATAWKGTVKFLPTFYHTRENYFTFLPDSGRWFSNLGPEKGAAGADGTPDSAYASATIGDKAYVFGGWAYLWLLPGGFAPSKWVFVYDLGNESGSARPAVKASRVRWPSAAAANGRIYLSGGAEAPTQMLEYSPGADLWLGKSPMPTARSKHASASLDDHVYLAGGVDGSGEAVDDFEVYYPELDPVSVPLE